MLHVIGTTAAGLAGLASAQRQLVDGAAVIAAPAACTTSCLLAPS